MHLTLQFLGDVSTAVLPDLGEAISHHVRSVCRFALSIEGLGIFPDAKRPRILWAGTVPSLALEHVALRVRRATAAWIGSDSTPFRPHITLGRFRARPLRPVIEGLLASNVDRRFGTMIVGHVSLVASQLSSAGACHRVLREYPLQEQS